MKNTRPMMKAWWFALALILVLQVIWHMPGTIALRNALLGTLVLSVGSLTYGYRKQIATTVGSTKLSMVFLGLLTAWIVLVNICFGDRPSLNWPEFLSHWLIPSICAFVAWLFGTLTVSMGKKSVNRVMTALFLVYFLQVFAHDVMSLVFLAEKGEFAFRNAPVLYLPEMLQGIGSGKPFAAYFSGHFFGFFSYVNAILGAFLVAEIVQRVLIRERTLNCPSWLLYVGIGLVIMCSYIIKARNGNIGLLMLLLMAALMVGYRLSARVSKLKVLGALSVFLIVFSMIGYTFIKSDSRWLTLVETAPVAWDTKTHLAWINKEPLPMLANGQSVDASNYERLAWFKEGLLLLEERPLGSGYDRNSWGGRIDSKYQMGGTWNGAHSHSGILDFAIATGIPGACLWLAFMGSLAWAGFRSFRGGNIAISLVLIFVVSGYFGRTLVDSVIRDHFLQVFMFLSGLLLALSQQSRVQESQVRKQVKNVI